MESGQRNASNIMKHCHSGKVTSNHFLTHGPNAKVYQVGKSNHFLDPSPRPRFKHWWCQLIPRSENTIPIQGTIGYRVLNNINKQEEKGDESEMRDDRGEGEKKKRSMYSRSVCN